MPESLVPGLATELLFVCQLHSHYRLRTLSDSELRIPSSGSNPAEVPRHTMVFPITAEATALKINWLATITSPLTPCLVGSERNLEFWMSFLLSIAISQLPHISFPIFLRASFKASIRLPSMRVVTESPSRPQFVTPCNTRPSPSLHSFWASSVDRCTSGCISSSLRQRLIRTHPIWLADLLT